MDDMNLEKLTTDELWKKREEAIKEREELTEALNTNEGRKGKTPKEISKMLQREAELNTFIESCRYKLLERQGRLRAL